MQLCRHMHNVVGKVTILAVLLILTAEAGTIDGCRSVRELCGIVEMDCGPTVQWILLPPAMWIISMILHSIPHRTQFSVYIYSSVRYISMLYIYTADLKLSPLVLQLTADVLVFFPVVVFGVNIFILLDSRITLWLTLH